MVEFEVTRSQIQGHIGVLVNVTFRNKILQKQNCYLLISCILNSNLTYVNLYL